MTPPRSDGPAGHRSRLRERLLKGGPSALADYEVLEMILFQASARGDTKPLAKRLLRQFGTFARIAGASPEELTAVEGCGAAAAAAIKSTEAAALMILKGRLREGSVLGAWDQVADYLRAAMATAPREEFRVLFLNAKNALIADEVISHGTVNQTAVFPREIARRALALSATAILLAHNHPSGDPTPSREDKLMTERIVAACKAVDVMVHDHVVVGAHQTISLRAMGLM